MSSTPRGPSSLRRRAFASGGVRIVRAHRSLRFLVPALALLAAIAPPLLADSAIPRELDDEPRLLDALDRSVSLDQLMGSSSSTGSARDVADDATFAVGAVSALALDDSGWTALRPSADSRRVYVSSSVGNDGHDGLAPDRPKRSIAAAKALLRHGYPDWLYLRRGDTWTESLGQWVTSGRSSSEPTVVTSYGDSDARPLLLTGSSDGVMAVASGTSPATLHDVAFVGLHLRAHTYDGQNGAPGGVNWLIDSSGLLVEDCEIERYQINVSVPGYGGRKRDVAIRRNVLTDAFATSGTVGHGIYLANCDRVSIEENVLDKNGWNTGVPGAVPSIFRHSIYVQSGSGTCTGVLVRGNIISDSSSHGLHLRPGGLCEDNLFLRNPIAISLGGGNEPDPGGVRASARDNVILDGRDIDAANRRGWGIDVANVVRGSVLRNIVAHGALGSAPIAMDLYGNLNGLGVHDVEIAGNVFWDWGGSVLVHGGGAQVTGVSMHDNVLRDGTGSALVEHNDPSSAVGLASAHNRCWSAAPASRWMRAGGTTFSLPAWKPLVHDRTSSVLASAPPDPWRTIATYHATLGGAPTHEAFLAQARTQSRATWRPEYTAHAANEYFRAGYGVPRL